MMRMVTGFAFCVLALGCGDDILVDSIDSSDDGAAVRIICDGSVECDEVASESLVKWLDSSADRSGAYTYLSSLELESGLRMVTEVDIESGAPVARRGSGVAPDAKTGALVAFEWSEVGETLGVHSDGARPVSISTLYEECFSEILGLDRQANRVVLELFASGALKSCSARAIACSGDCTRGPVIDSILLSAE